MHWWAVCLVVIMLGLASVPAGAGENEDELGVECVVRRLEDDPDGPTFQHRSQADAAEFMIRRLRAARDAQ